jgi:Leucine-rich repeat (LRR) protein
LIVSISRSQVKTITSESFLFGNYLKTHYLFKKNNLKFLDYEEINNINSSVWFICTNNMRANTSLENLQDYRFVKCSSNKLEIKMKIIEEINIPDFQARLYAKK